MTEREQPEPKHSTEERPGRGEEHPAPSGPKEKGQQWQSHRFGRVAADEGIDQNIGSSHIGHGRHQGCSRAEQVAHPKKHEDAAQKDGRGIEQV